MTKVRIIFPHQLFEDTQVIREPVYLVEESLFFNQYAFHRRKLTVHRASMQSYHQLLQQRGMQVE
ncbi:MAG: cryptochrome/photolyase family protein, partial [Bacteroidota bacterium]